eukprot:NODE_1121_length_602_cov_1040.320072_g1047_i0.p1 GENE.NODE_1121_length_602_cov_1040.320072_g1047_i0~~NODE_1121_length_602_cov_1040.320072_g1047_i0.p1  ORF type:complete len:107 (+),score=32.88 NODE_1121_length_602_cov_1040.320072_g1047_i0:55-375(+)
MNRAGAVNKVVHRAVATTLVAKRNSAVQVFDVTLNNLGHAGAGMAAAGCGPAAIGVGACFNGLLNGAARQPNLAGQLFGYTLIGMAMCEVLGMLSFAVAMLLLFAI